MLAKLQLTNFKGFNNQTVELDEFSVVVGRNNAGKSTLIESIRLLSSVISRFCYGSYVEAPNWTGVSGIGIAPVIDDLKIRAETLFYNYQVPPAIIHATFLNGVEIHVYLGAEGVVYCAATDSKGKQVRSRQHAKKVEFPDIAILPQIQPLEDRERTLRKNYIEKCMDTHLSSRHFRNQIRYSYEFFDSFRDLLEQTWERVRISSFDDPNSDYDTELWLLLSEDGFVAEASNFGHGLQMWLQIIWFLSRTSPTSLVILDEPDVYMHPDQQSKLLGVLRGRFRQCIFSTHSTTIIEQCEPSDLLRVHRALTVSKKNISTYEFERLVDQALSESRHLKLNQNDTWNGTNSSQSEIQVKVVLYDYASIVARDGENRILFEFDAPGEDTQITEMFGLPNSDMVIGLTDPSDAELYINGILVDFSPYWHERNCVIKIKIDTLF